MKSRKKTKMLRNALRTFLFLLLPFIVLMGLSLAWEHSNFFGMHKTDQVSSGSVLKAVHIQDIVRALNYMHAKISVLGGEMKIDGVDDVFIENTVSRQRLVTEEEISDEIDIYLERNCHWVDEKGWVNYGKHGFGTVCNGGVLVGATSFHKNNPEARFWRFKCCYYGGIPEITSTCETANAGQECTTEWKHIVH